ncbi:class I SAM-dependent methyltransferase [soil metagenome]
MLSPIDLRDLARVLEPEVVDTELDAAEYQGIDNREVNRVFVERALELGPKDGSVLDLGAGPGDIAILLARTAPGLRVVAIDLAEHMLALARIAVHDAGWSARVEIACRDAKATGFPDSAFDLVVANSLVHHIPEPREVFREVARMLRPGGALFIKDLLRPKTESELHHLVATYAKNDSDYQRTLFENSLHAALRVDEVERLCEEAGLTDVTVARASDRHWTIERAAVIVTKREAP